MLSDLNFRFRSLFRRKAVENELEEELQFHFEQQVEKHLRAGLSRQEAVLQTRLEFGNLGKVKEDCRESRGITLLVTAVQDVRYTVRQLIRTPVFTITVLLTLALGIGANAAIFTLVNAVLLKKLPVADLASLVRLGDNDDCCQGSGLRRNGDYAMFSTDAYEQLKRNVPEFEELAAMQAGFAGRPIIARRDGSQAGARSAIGEFVSGNYFGTFGLQPRAGRLLMDSDDTQGAPMTAVMSYEAWQRNYAGDASVVGSTFWVNTKPVTIVGIAPEGFYGDRLNITPPEFYLPIETMPELLGAPFVHDPETNWLYIVGRIKPGVAIAPLQEKVTGLLRQVLATYKYFSSESRNCRPCTVDCLRQHCQSSAGAWYGASRGNLNARRARSHARKNYSSTAYRKHCAGRIGRSRRTRRCLCRSAHAADVGIPGCTKHADTCRPVSSSSRVCVRVVVADRNSVRLSPGMDCGTGRADRCSTEQPADCNDGSFLLAALTRGTSGWAIACAAGGRRIVSAEPEKT
jgi:hypothetical protein